MTFPQVIVLILNWNGKFLLEECISSYLTNDYPNYSLIVIDNGSTDGSEYFVKKVYPDIRVIQTGENLGYSGGFNVGLKYAFESQKADYVLITNNDVKADSRVITELVNVALRNPQIGFVSGKVYYYDNPKVLQTVGKQFDPVYWNGNHIGGRENDNGQYNEITERHFIDDIFTLVSQNVYSTIGGYDSTFFLQGEEYDWQARAKKEGFKIYYTPHAKIWHKESITLGKSSPKKAYYDSRNPLIVIMKHKSRKFFIRYLRAHLGNVVLLPSIRVLVKELDIFKAWMIWKGFLSAIIWYTKHRKECFMEEA